MTSIEHATRAITKLREEALGDTIAAAEVRKKITDLTERLPRLEAAAAEKAAAASLLEGLLKHHQAVSNG